MQGKARLGFGIGHGLRISSYELENNNIIIPTKRVLKSNGKQEKQERQRGRGRERASVSIVNRFYSWCLGMRYAGLEGVQGRRI